MGDEEQYKKHKQWIREYLIPNLIENRKLFPSETRTIEVKTIEMQEKSADAVTPINRFTFNYMVTISVIIADDGILQSNVHKKITQKNFDLVVKVRLKKSKRVCLLRMDKKYSLFR